jgi:hypothetical protein
MEKLITSFILHKITEKKGVQIFIVIYQTIIQYINLELQHSLVNFHHQWMMSMSMTSSDELPCKQNEHLFRWQ